MVVKERKKSMKPFKTSFAMCTYVDTGEQHRTFAHLFACQTCSITCDVTVREISQNKRWFSVGEDCISKETSRLRRYLALTAYRTVRDRVVLSKKLKRPDVISSMIYVFLRSDYEDGGTCQNQVQWPSPSSFGVA